MTTNAHGSQRVRKVNSAFSAAVMVAAAALSTVSTGAPAFASPATIIGSLSNFDTFNDTGQEAHGFEIELEGVHSADVQYFFGAPYNRYGTPNVVEFTDGARWGTRVRWESPADARGMWAATTAIGPVNPTPTDGHSCYLNGPAGATQAQYDASGCEHFGIGLYGNPTATTYHWLVDDGTNSGRLAYAPGAVSVPAPVWSVSPAGNVAAALPAPAPAPVLALPGIPDCALWGEAIWVKVYKTESPEPAQLGGLLTESNDVPQSQAEVESEWQFLQGRPTCDESGVPLANQPDNELVHEAAAGAGSKSVTRRYEFFKYTGAYDDTDGGKHEALPLCDSNPYKQSCGSPAGPNPNSDLGGYIGAQMAAGNLAAFGANISTLSVAKDGDGTGIVTDGGGISCGDLCGGAYSTGDFVTLTATPDAGSRVAAWSVPGCGVQTSCTFAMSQDRVVTVTFTTGAVGVPPTVTGLSVATANPGTSVTIHGVDFDGLQSVLINNTQAEVVTATATSITVLVPCAVGSAPVDVVTSHGAAQTAPLTVAIAKPVVATFSPASALMGSPVTVSGMHLACVTAVAVGGAAADITSRSHTSLSFIVPMTASTNVIGVVSPAGSVTTKSKLTVIPVPSITGFSPSHALPGAKVVVTGSALAGASSVTINGTTAKFSVSGSTKVTVTVPAGATSGTLVIKVPSAALTAAAELTVDTPSPTISSLSVGNGAVGTSITIKGANFTRATQVFIGAKPIRGTVVSPTVLVATVSAGATTGNLKVTTEGGTAVYPAAFGVGGSATSAITKSSVKSAAGATVATITGTNLGAVDVIRIAGVAASFTVLTATTAAVVIPPGARVGSITGTTFSGANITGPTITVGAGTVAPTVTAVSPAAAVFGQWVKVTGTNVAAVTAVSWSGKSCDFYVTAANAIYVKTPRGASTGGIVVTTAGGSVASPVVAVS